MKVSKRYIILGYVLKTTSIWKVWNPASKRQTIVTDCMFGAESFGDPNGLVVLQAIEPERLLSH